MKILEAAKRVVRYRSTDKISLDSYLDPLFVGAAANGALVVGALELMDKASQIVRPEYEGATIAAVGAASLAGLAFANKKVVWPVMKGINRLHKKRINKGKQASSLSWIKTGMGAGMLFYAASTPKSQNSYHNLQALTSRAHGFVERVIHTEEISPGEELVLQESVPEDLKTAVSPNDLRKYSIRSTKGKFLRTARWSYEIEEAEKARGIETGLLAGLIMRESMGNPLQLNFGNDGGAGLMMFQPGTARAYNLQIHGNSRITGRDRAHGDELLKLVRAHNYDYPSLSSLDERFDVEKSIMAGAHFLSDLKRRFGNWDAALSAYNRGRPARNPLGTNHVREIRSNQKYYLRHIAETEVKAIKAEEAEEKEIAIKNPLPNNNYGFRRIRTTHDGYDIIKFRDTPGDTPLNVVTAFNLWDDNNGNRYQLVDARNVVDRSGDTTTHTNGPKFYVKVKRN